jgi:hypothetical protein
MDSGSIGGERVAIGSVNIASRSKTGPCDAPKNFDVFLDSSQIRRHEVGANCS